MRYFNIDDIHEIESMTFYEYQLRMTAFRLKLVDEQFSLSFAAWQNREINATDDAGKYIYRKMDDFFNYRLKEEAAFLGIDEETLKNKRFNEHTKELAERFRKASNNRGKEEKNG